MPEYQLNYWRELTQLKEHSYYLYCVTLLKTFKSFIRITFQGSSPHGKDRSWSDDLK